MAGRFKYDNKVFEVINVIVDLLVLGFFWIITSIPILLWEHQQQHFIIQ